MDAAVEYVTTSGFDWWTHGLCGPLIVLKKERNKYQRFEQLINGVQFLLNYEGWHILKKEGVSGFPVRLKFQDKQYDTYSDKTSLSCKQLGERIVLQVVAKLQNENELIKELAVSHLKWSYRPMKKSKNVSDNDPQATHTLYIEGRSLLSNKQVNLMLSIPDPRLASFSIKKTVKLKRSISGSFVKECKKISRSNSVMHMAANTQAPEKPPCSRSYSVKELRNSPQFKDRSSTAGKIQKKEPPPVPPRRRKKSPRYRSHSQINLCDKQT